MTEPFARGESPTFFAPMEGVTSPPVRELWASRGSISVVCTEFVRVTSQPLSTKVLAKHVVRPSQGLLSVQVMGRDLVQMAEATELVTRAGADIVDINLGCPAPKAVRKGVGSAMLKDRGLLEKVVGEMRRRTHLPLSAKIRAGFDDKSGVLGIAKTLQDAGVDFLTVHPRRRVDFYEGVADWRIVRLLASELTIPVIGNGDLWYATDALRLEREAGCAGLMFGRPALRNPWIFQQLAALRRGVRPPHPDGVAVVAHVHRLVELFRTELDDKCLLGLLKEQVRYLGRAVRDDGVSLRAALRSTAVDELLRVIEEHWAPLAPTELDLGSESLGGERTPRVATPEESGETGAVPVNFPGHGFGALLPEGETCFPLGGSAV